jgi:hypothetical protein
MGPRRGRHFAAAALAGCVLCGAALALASCGGDSEDAASSAPTTVRTTTAPLDAAPPALGGRDGRGGGASGGPSAGERRAHRRLVRFARAMAEACAHAEAPPLAPLAHGSPRWRAQVAALRRSRAWLRSLRDKLRGVPVARGDARLRKLARAYRRAVHHEIALDRIVAAGLASQDDRLGVDAGERQIAKNGATRRRIARVLEVDCLARFAAG